MPHVMIDLETLSTANNALILSIGAVKFVEDGILDRFHVVIHPGDAQNYNLHIDADTVLWWMALDRQTAREQLLKSLEPDGDAVDLYSALDGFTQWFGNDSMPVWGNGATFDNVILRNAFKAANVQCPWKFWDDRCYRTMKNHAPGIELERKGTHHNALDDATYQAEHLMKIWKELR